MPYLCHISFLEIIRKGTFKLKPSRKIKFLINWATKTLLQNIPRESEVASKKKQIVGFFRGHKKGGGFASSVHARLNLFDNTASMVFYMARLSTPLQTHAVF